MLSSVEIVPERRWQLPACLGGEVSNDHHAYYEAAFAISPTGELRLLKWRRYYYDFAGLEGIAHWLAALAGGMAAVIAWTITAAVRLAWRAASRRYTSGTA
jgi:hypothetical protein